MSEETLATRPSKSTPTAGLHPLLQGAMRSLDVNLEEELKRYRRQKAGEPPLPRRGLTASYQNGKSGEVSSLMTGSVALQHRSLPTAELPRAIALSGDEYKQQPSSSLALVRGEESTPEKLVGTASSENFVKTADLETEPQDYLESSEELLKSLTSDFSETVDPAAEATATGGSWRRGLLTPLGIGSMLLLLMTGGTLMVVVANPSIVRHLRASQIDTKVQSDRQQGTIPKYAQQPNQQQVDLSLDSLSTLPTKSSPSPVASPVEPNPPVNRSNTSSAPEPSVKPIPRIVPLPIVTDQPTPATRSGPSAPVLDAGTEVYYYVVTDYDTDKSLEQVREIMPDAYVRDFPQGLTKIQVARLRSSSTATALVEVLARRGIPAEVYQNSP